jgi:hypothetical protein
MNLVQQTLELVKETGLYPGSNSLSAAQRPVVQIHNDQLIMFVQTTILPGFADAEQSIKSKVIKTKQYTPSVYGFIRDKGLSQTVTHSTPS